MNESEKQFSFTRVASSTSGHAKKQIPISSPAQLQVQAGARKANSYQYQLFAHCCSVKKAGTKKKFMTGIDSKQETNTSNQAVATTQTSK
jgi:hypothetical protein